MKTTNSYQGLALRDRKQTHLQRKDLFHSESVCCIFFFYPPSNNYLTIQATETEDLSGGVIMLEKQQAAANTHRRYFYFVLFCMLLIHLSAQYGCMVDRFRPCGSAALPAALLSRCNWFAPS